MQSQNRAIAQTVLDGPLGHACVQAVQSNGMVQHANRYAGAAHDTGADMGVWLYGKGQLSHRLKIRRPHRSAKRVDGTPRPHVIFRFRS